MDERKWTSINTPNVLAVFWRDGHRADRTKTTFLEVRRHTAAGGHDLEIILLECGDCPLRYAGARGALNMEGCLRRRHRFCYGESMVLPMKMTGRVGLPQEIHQWFGA